MYPISRYLNIQQAYFPSFAPDGQHIAFLSNITGTPQVWRVALASQPGQVLWPDQLTFEADRVLGVWYSPVDDGQLLYARDVGGNENAQLFLLRTDGAEEIPLTQGYENAMHIFGEWSQDGKHILFAANRRHPGLFDLYLQPLDGDAHMVWQHDQPGFLHDLMFAPDGQHAVVSRTSSAFRHDLFEIDLQTGTVRHVAPRAARARRAAAAVRRWWNRP